MTYVLSRKPEIGIDQPPGAVIIDRGNPLTEGLVLSCYNSVKDMMMPPRNLVTGETGIATGTKTTGRGIAANAFNSLSGGIGDSVQFGRRQIIRNAVRFTGSSSSWSWLPLDLGAYSIFTMAFWMVSFSNSGTTPMCFEYPADFVDSGFFFTHHGNISGGSLGPQSAMGTLPASFDLQSDTPPPDVGSFHHYIIPFNRDSGTSGSWIVDGSPTTTVGFGTAQHGNFSSPGGLNFGGRNQGTTFNGNCALACVQGWGDRLLTNEEGYDYYRNTWQFLRPAVCAYDPETTS